MISAMTPSPAPLAYAEAPVVDGMRSRFVDTATGLRMHLLEAGTPGQPVVVLLHGFLRAYYHVKSADWTHNEPHPRAGWNGAALAHLPHYNVMPTGLGMPAAVAAHAPAADAAARGAWLPDADLAVYTAEFARTGFQGGLNWYRCIADPAQMRELQLFDGARITVPACYIAGAAEWGIYQIPGAFERMQREVCTRMSGVNLLPGAGHWVQQEQPAQVSSLLLDFLQRANDERPPRVRRSLSS